MRLSIGLLGLLVILAGCGGSHKKDEHKTKQRKKKITLATNIDVALEIVREQEARLADIPIPLDAQPFPYSVDDSLSTEHIMLGYNCDLEHDAVILFYEQEMERNGWQKTAQYKGFETLLHFSKPQRFCAVSIRPRFSKKATKVDKGVGIFIFTGDKIKVG